MKNAFFFIIFLFLFHIVFAQNDAEYDNGSNISISNLDDKTITHLEILGKIWGFLKYYHPEIGKGNYNWDYELFRILPRYIVSKTIKERDEILLNWIKTYGDIEMCDSCRKFDDNAPIKADLNWISNYNFSNQLRDILNTIKNSKPEKNHYYISVAPAGNPEFKNENPYSNMPYPDQGFRLLALYKYWNMIQYYFPYKYLIDKDWGIILKEYIPLFLNAKNELEYELVTLQIIGDIKDTHANLWGGSDKIQLAKGLLFSPVNVRFIENKLVVTDYYNINLRSQVGLEVGDIITSINGKSIKTIIKENEKYFPASNQPTRLRNMSRDILRSNSKFISINYIRNGKELEKNLPLFTRQEIKINEWYRGNPNKKSFKLINDNIGYITLKNIKKEDIELIQKEFKNTKGIIVDIRNYPSEFVVFSLGNFLSSTRSDFVKFTKMDKKTPGQFTYTEPLKVGINRPWSYKNGHVVILINELSQSQAEYTTMAFRSGKKTTVIGSTTAGADGNVSRISLPGGLRTMISGIGVYYPDGTETQRIGIIPDIEVLPTIKGVKEGRDELLEKAIEIINKN